ncbi:uncharacterized protein [Apostichopus japonicus]|uniref:uncharacterized protein isoform X2 n=1 Tax=Stichopus japonicus TaxID=307972 RepID=UPI003AB4C211
MYVCIDYMIKRLSDATLTLTHSKEIISIDCGIMANRKRTSPFQKRGRSERPTLKFQDPRDTEEFVLSQDKTDYTYSRSPSYSSQSNPQDMDSYEIPYMSRRSIKGSRAPPQVTPPRRQPSMEPQSSRRRSARLAGRPMDEPPAQHTSTQYPSNARLIPGGGRPSTTEPHHGSTSVRVPYKAPSFSSRSGLFSERDYRDDEQSLTHLYGLDQYDDPEVSDTESSQANCKLSSSLDNTDSSSEWSERRSPVDIIHIIKVVIVTAIYITTYPPRTVYSYLKSKQQIRTPVSSQSSTAGNAVKSVLHSLSHTLYTLVASSLLLDVWTLTRTREWLSNLGIATPITAGLKQGSFTSLLTSRSSAESHHNTMQRRRRGGGFPCWICLLLLLLPILTSLYLFWGFVPFLMPLAVNETNETEPLAAVSDGMAVILTSLGEDVGSTPSAAAAGAATGGAMAGCLQCLKREDLMLMIAGLMKDNTEKLQDQILEQNKQILLMLKHGSEQEKKINQLELLIQNHQREVSSNRANSLNVDSSVEEELAQVRAELRNLVHMNAEELTSDQRFDSVQAFKTDMDRLTSKISNLHKAFEESKTSQDALEISLTNSGSEMEGRVTETMESVLSLQDNFKLRLIELEDRLKDLKTVVVVLENSRENKQDQINSLVKLINDLEREVVDVKSMLKQLEVALENLKSDFSDRGDRQAISTLRSDFETQKAKFVTLEYQLTTHVDEIGNMKSQMEILKDDVSLLDKRTNAADENAMKDKQLFGTLLQKTSESNSQHIQELSSNLEARFQGLLEDGKAVDSDDVIGLRQSIQSNSDRLRGLESDREELASSVSDLSVDIERNAGALKLLEGNLTSLHNILNGTGGADLSRQRGGALMVIQNIQTLEKDLHSMKLKVEGMQSLQAAVDGTGSISEAALAQLAELQASTLKLEGKLMDASESITDINADVEDLQSSLGLLQERTASRDGSPITFEGLQSDLESVHETVVVLRDGLDRLEKENSEQEVAIAAVVADSSQVSERLTSDDGEMIDLIAMQSNLYTFHTDSSKLEAMINSLQNDISGQNERLGLVLVDRDNQYNVEDRISTFRADIASMSDNLAVYQSTTVQSDGDDGGNGAVAAGLVDLGSKVTLVEAGLAALQSGRDGKDMEDLQRDVNALKEQVISLRRKQESSSESGGLGAGAGFHSDEDITDLKSEFSKLNARYDSLNTHFNDCCQYKSEMLGVGLSPGYGFLAAEPSENGTEDTEKIKGIVYGILNQYSADKTGMVDYALESAGGSVVSTRCSETFTSKTALLSIFGIPLWYVTNSPRTVLQPDVNPGNCWAFKGAVGFLVIQLSDTIKPTYFTMEHIPKSLSPTGNITSAPRNFSVWSLKDEHDIDGVLLGEYMYDDEGYPVQVFSVQNVEIKPTMMVELKIHSNYGSLEYTCLYRFRVHGDLYRP